MGWVLGSGEPANKTVLESVKLPWRYIPLDPGVTAARAHEAHSKKHCMYAVFASILGQLGEKLGPPHSTFPLDMMIYGMGGVAGWGSICGTLNGAAALFGLVARTDMERLKLTQDLFHWYEQTALPIYTPPGNQMLNPFPTATPGSVLCHASSGRWCKATGYKHSSPERVERCRRLSGSVAQKSVEMLNALHANETIAHFESSSATRQCQSCHTTSAEKGSILGQGSCSSCHAIGANHPSKS